MYSEEIWSEKEADPTKTPINHQCFLLCLHVQMISLNKKSMYIALFSYVSIRPAWKHTFLCTLFVIVKNVIHSPLNDQCP